jgi:hypothetical protein
MSTTLIEMTRTGSKEIEDAAALYWLVTVHEGRFIEAGQTFLEHAEGLDRAAIVRAAAKWFANRFPNATAEEAERAIWRDMRRLFQWCDLAETEPGGSA